MRKADYTYTIQGDTVKIIDLNRGNVSVTNDAENVLTEIQSTENIKELRIIYRDSMDEWCELIPVWDNNKCTDVNFSFL